jgi:hydroxymethylbilane synthase
VTGARTTPLRIGTRGSALALVQARYIADQLSEESEIVVISTAGDRGELLEDKSRWTSALEAALLSERIDIAVHSAKDVPGEIPRGLELLGSPAREDPTDALVGFDALSAVPEGARVGTASLRRAAQLRSLRPDLRIVELRGNVPTRLAKLDAGEADAIVLASAGLIRLELSDRIGCRLPELVPAPGQGALAVEARAGDSALPRDLRTLLRGTPAMLQLRAERTFAAAIGATCHTPVGAWAGGRNVPRVVRGTHVELTAWVGLPDGSEWIADTLSGTPGEVGVALAERMTSAGARELLTRAEEQVG